MYVDEPLEDMKYLLKRLKKYERKAAYWATLSDLTIVEIQNIAAYNSRIARLIYEYSEELSPKRVKKRRDVAYSRARVLVYDFGPELDQLRAPGTEFARLFDQVAESVQRIVDEKYLRTFRLHNLKKRFMSRRGRIPSNASHRDQNQRPGERIDLRVSTQTASALKAAMRESECTMTDLLIEASERFLHEEYPEIAQDLLV